MTSSTACPPSPTSGTSLQTSGQLGDLVVGVVPLATTTGTFSEQRNVEIRSIVL